MSLHCKSIDNIIETIFNNLSLRYNQDGLVDDQDLISDAIKYANNGQKAGEPPL